MTMAAMKAIGWTKKYSGTPTMKETAARMKYILEEIGGAFLTSFPCSGIVSLGSAEIHLRLLFLLDLLFRFEADDVDKQDR